MPSSTSLRSLFTFSFTFAVLLLGFSTMAADLQTKSRFDLSSQPLAKALNAFAIQAGLNIYFDPPAVEGIRSPSLKAELTADDALAHLLAGTKLQAVYVDENTIRIVPMASAAARAQSSAARDDGSAGMVRLSRSEMAGADAITRRPGAAESDEEQKTAADARGEKSATNELVVTGTSIRGQAPVGAPLIVFDREQIERSGYATIQDFMETVPQNYGGNSLEVFSSIGNFTRTQGVNLRGLGTGATLVLINGQRQPRSAEGQFTDLSSIPASAVERIEIMPDGASAIYGSEAIGGVVNIILRKEYFGAESQARFASARSDSEEVQFSQSLGRGWRGGNLLFGYQYYERTELAAEERGYAGQGDKRPFGGSDRRTTRSNPGNILIPGSFTAVAFGIPASQDGSSLTVADLMPGVANLGFAAGDTSLAPQQESHSAFFSVAHEINARWQVSADGRYTRRSTDYLGTSVTSVLTVPSSNAFYVDAFGTGEPLRILYDFGRDFRRVTVGDTDTLSLSGNVRLDLSASWGLSGSVTYGSEKSSSWSRNFGTNFANLSAALADSNPATAFNPFGDGSFNNPETIASIILPPQMNEPEYVNWSYRAVADGNLFALPAGTVTAAVGAEYRTESLLSALAGIEQSADELDRDVSSLFAEVNLPLIARSGSRGTLLRASLAGRYEDYSDFGNTFNPKFGLHFQPNDWLSISGTWGTSFRAPPVVLLDEIINAFAYSINDPLALDGSGVSNVILALGNNPSLQQETADTWSVGFQLTPEAVAPGLQLSLRYHEIDYDNKILSVPYRLLSSGGDVLAIPIYNETGIIDRSPPAELLERYCADMYVDCVSYPPNMFIDARFRNIAALRTRGFDFEGRSRLNTDAGLFEFAVSGVYNISYEQQFIAGVDFTEQVNTRGAPPKLVMRSTAYWERGAWVVDGSVNYTNAYDDVGVSRRINSWTTVDAGATYRIQSPAGFMSGVAIGIRAANLLDEDPPFVDTDYGFDASVASPLGRLLSVNLTKSW